MVARPKYAPALDPRAVAKLLGGKVPAKWQSGGRCRSCGPVLLPGEGLDYGELPECPWCLVRQSGRPIPAPEFVRARLRERRPRPPDYFKAWGAPENRAARAPEGCPEGVLVRARSPAAGGEEPIGHIGEVPHHPLDAGWIEAQLARLDDPLRRSRLRRRYGEVYRAAWEAEPDPVRKEGRARFEANSGLREQVDTAASERPCGDYRHNRRIRCGE